MKNLIMALVLLLLTSCTSLVNMYNNSNKNNIVIHEGQIAVIPEADQLTFKVLDNMSKTLSKNGSVWVKNPHKPSIHDGKSIMDIMNGK